MTGHIEHEVFGFVTETTILHDRGHSEKIGHVVLSRFGVDRANQRTFTQNRLQIILGAFLPVPPGNILGWNSN
jgi:hypothetical protein